MPAYVELSSDQMAEIRAHLLQGTKEYVAFAFAKVESDGGLLRLVAEAAYMVPEEEYEHQSMFRVELTEEAQAKIIKEAWDRGTTLVEFHSHPTADTPVWFSGSDLYGFAEFVPHVRWRLTWKPYAAVVVGPDSFDGLVWTDRSGVPEPLAGLDVGGHVWVPTNLTLSRKVNGYGRSTV